MTALLPIWGPKLEPVIVIAWFPAVFIVVVDTARPDIEGDVYLKEVENADVVCAPTVNLNFREDPNPVTDVHLIFVLATDTVHDDAVNDSPSVPP